MSILEKIIRHPNTKLTDKLKYYVTTFDYSNIIKLNNIDVGMKTTMHKWNDQHNTNIYYVKSTMKQAKTDSIFSLIGNGFFAYGSYIIATRSILGSILLNVLDVHVTGIDLIDNTLIYSPSMIFGGSTIYFCYFGIKNTMELYRLHSIDCELDENTLKYKTLGMKESIDLIDKRS